MTSLIFLHTAVKCRPTSLLRKVATPVFTFALQKMNYMVEAITDGASIRKYLDGVGLPFEPPVPVPARPPTQEVFFFEDRAEAF
ncbi:MAG: hypothetical protein JXX14_23300 [Deltaproteobacteria bacterium]|nr:hypothetical protein [Deltaproteobacteria bacterium]